MNLITSQLFLVLWKFCYSYFLNGLWWTVTRQFLDHWLFLFSDFLLVFHVFRKVQQSKSWSVNLLKISAGNSHCWKVFKKFLGKSGRPTAAVKVLALRHFFSSSCPNTTLLLTYYVNIYQYIIVYEYSSQTFKFTLFFIYEPWTSGK